MGEEPNLATAVNDMPLSSMPVRYASIVESCSGARCYHALKCCTTHNACTECESYVAIPRWDHYHYCYQTAIWVERHVLSAG